MTWFRAIWWVTGQKNGASALGLKRMLGLGSYRTAWTWLHKLRRAMVRPGRDKLSGVVEVDESFIGGKKPGKRGRGAKALGEFGLEFLKTPPVTASYPLCRIGLWGEVEFDPTKGVVTTD